MAGKPKRLEPKGREGVEDAVGLLNRGRQQSAPEPGVATEPEVAAESEPKAEVAPAPELKPAKRARRTAEQSATAGRTDAEGMKRRTYYLAAADVDAFEAAADRIHTALGSLVPKHKILGALIADGVNNADAVLARLKAELVAGLG